MSLTKPAVTSVWASTAADNVQPTDAYIAAGWPLSTTPPSRGRFNWLLNYLYNGIRYLCRRGISDYDAAETYMLNDKVVGPDGATYISLVDNNIAHTPASSQAQWQRWGFGMSDFNATLASNGSQILPSGLIMKWGTGQAGPAGSAAANSFPTPFPNACFFVSAIHLGTDQTVNVIIDSAAAPSKNGFSLRSTNASGTVTCFWQAFGY